MTEPETETTAVARLLSPVHLDALTGLPMADQLVRHLQAALSRASAADLPVSLIIADLDNFARVNKAFGRDIGDQAIVELLALLASAARPHDLVCRHGDDDLLIVLFDADLAEAEAWAVHSCALLAEQSVPSIARPITASFGVAEHDGDEGTEQLIDRAFDAMRQAKKLGRNRVAVAG